MTMYTMKHNKEMKRKERKWLKRKENELIKKLWKDHERVLKTEKQKNASHHYIKNLLKNDHIYISSFVMCSNLAD